MNEMSQIGTATTEEMKALLTRQRAAQLAAGPPSAEERIDRINRVADLIIRHREAFEKALSDDFGHRSVGVTAFADIAASVAPLTHAAKNVRKWMKPEKRGVEFPLGLLGASARIEHQPKGVVGVMAPWNFPVYLALGPLAGVFAAGNRAMIKPSEFTPATSELMRSTVAESFDETELAVINGGPEVGATFSALPFDHLMFTGATAIARHVMRAASENLVPLTLELGGKSPVIVGKSADMEKAAKRIMFGKVMNAGQICLAPDYTMVPEGSVDTFVNHAEAAVTGMLPDGARESDDYTSIINTRHYDRLQNYLKEAEERGVETRVLNAKDEDFDQQPHHRMPVTLVINPPDDLGVMKDEIFGPVMAVKTYSGIDDAIDYVNERDRPLALYYFGEDKAEEQRVLNRTTSGGVTVNDVIFHIAQEELPFGGIGPSGMGNHHGHHGFREFSHQKAIYRQIGAELLKILRPPYGGTYFKQINSRIKR